MDYQYGTINTEGSLTAASPTTGAGRDHRYTSTDAMRFWAGSPPLPDRWAPARERAGLPDWPYCRSVPAPLRPVVNDLHERQEVVATLADLAAYDTGLAPDQVAKTLRRAGWLKPLRAQKVWRVATTPFSGAPGFDELVGRLAASPDTPAAIAGRSVPHLHGWLRTPTEPAIGLWPEAKLPRCLNHYVVRRWKPRAPLCPIGGVPAWSADTLVVFMAAKPAQFPWSYIGDWLPQGCDYLTADGTLTELDRRPRSVWHKTAYIAHRGERDDIADTVLEHAPPGKGPYPLGVRHGWHTRPAQWQPRFEVIDNVLPHRWFPKAEYLRASRPDPT